MKKIIIKLYDENDEDNPIVDMYITSEQLEKLKPAIREIIFEEVDEEELLSNF